jgi:hypothetical protein
VLAQTWTSSSTYRKIIKPTPLRISILISGMDFKKPRFRGQVHVFVAHDDQVAGLINSLQNCLGMKNSFAEILQTRERLWMGRQIWRLLRWRSVTGLFVESL